MYPPCSQVSGFVNTSVPQCSSFVQGANALCPGRPKHAGSKAAHDDKSRAAIVKMPPHCNASVASVAGASTGEIMPTDAGRPGKNPLIPNAAPSPEGAPSEGCSKPSAQAELSPSPIRSTGDSLDSEHSLAAPPSDFSTRTESDVTVDTGKGSLKSAEESRGSIGTNDNGDSGADREVTYYTECSTCTAVYEMKDPTVLGRGRKVECCVCGNVWFQKPDRLSTLPQDKQFKDYPIEEKDRLIRENREKRPQRERREPVRATGEQRQYRSERPSRRPYPDTARAGTGKVAFVGNLSFEASDKDLEALVSSVAQPVRISIVKHRDTGRSRGFGFVTFKTDEDKRAVIEQLSGVMFKGRSLTVREANEK